jgi:hypothetical protein
MHASEVTFRNPAWIPWLDGVIQEVCQALGVNAKASRPQAELYKLLLYEAGSQ